MNCIIATILPKSGISLPSSPASFMRLRLSSGLRSEVRMSRNSRLASASRRSVAVDQPQRAGEQLQRVGMVFQPVPVGEPEQPQQVDRIALEHLVVGDVDAVVVDDEIAGAGELALAPREAEEDAVEAGHVLGLLLLERGAEDAGQVADILGDQEVVLHEALDRRQAGMAGIAEPLGDLALDVEMQPLLGLAGEEMHVAAHRPQEILGLAGTGCIRRA